MVLQEDNGEVLIDLGPEDLGPDSRPASFYIRQENDKYYMWLNTYKVGSGCPDTDQLLESDDGLVWENRTDTNLEVTGSYKRTYGIGEVITDGTTYHGWGVYYYEWSAGWGSAIRYITSSNGITWNIINQPALIGAGNLSVIKNGSTYHLWATRSFDPNFYGGTYALRYRISTSPGTGWGHWQTGGTTAVVDGNEVTTRNRVRQQDDDSYQMFYVSGTL